MNKRKESRRSIYRVLGVLALALGIYRPLLIEAAPQRAVNQDALVMQDFENRVAQYAHLHQQVESKLPPLKPNASPEEIAGHTKALARQIQRSRPHARQGSIFTRRIAAEFHRLIHLTLRGPNAKLVLTSLRNAHPVRMKLQVNEVYPPGIPLQSTPPSLLLNLPKLPPEVEYRVVGHDLALRDVKAGVIVDFLPQAIP